MINFAELKGYLPGFDDTNPNYTIEYNILTSLGKCDLFKTCKSIKPVILINYHTLFSDKGKGLKEIINIIRKILPNFEEEKSKLNVFYTHCNEN